MCEFHIFAFAFGLLVFLLMFFFVFYFRVNLFVGCSVFAKAIDNKSENKNIVFQTINCNIFVNRTFCCFHIQFDIVRWWQRVELTWSCYNEMKIKVFLLYSIHCLLIYNSGVSTQLWHSCKKTTTTTTYIFIGIENESVCRESAFSKSHFTTVLQPINNCVYSYHIRTENDISLFFIFGFAHFLLCTSLLLGL